MLPTAWQAVAYADPEPEGTLLVLGLGPIGDMACRIALHRGVRQVIGVDLRRRASRAGPGAGCHDRSTCARSTTSATRCAT